jgi:hypothetical protein
VKYGRLSPVSIGLRGESFISTTTGQQFFSSKNKSAPTTNHQRTELLGKRIYCIVLGCTLKREEENAKVLVNNFPLYVILVLSKSYFSSFDYYSGLLVAIIPHARATPTV